MLRAAIAALLCVLLASAPAFADVFTDKKDKRDYEPEPPPGAPPANKNGITLEAGGQIGYVTYGSFLRLGVGYHRWLSGRMYLDFVGGVLVRKETDIVFNGGVRFKFGGRSGWKPFERVGGELAILARLSQTRVVIAARGGGGAGYFSKGGTGLTLQAGVALGPAFGGGVNFALSSDVMIGAEIPF